MNLRFARAEEADAVAIVSVQNAAFHDDFQRYGECPAYDESVVKVRESIASDIVYKVIFDNALIGVAHVKRRSANHYYLRVLCIHPTYQHRGVGSRMLRRLFASHPEATEWSLITPKDNHGACSLYEKAGFICTGYAIHSTVLTLARYRKGNANEDSRC